MSERDEVSFPHIANGNGKINFVRLINRFTVCDGVDILPSVAELVRPLT